MTATVPNAKLLRSATADEVSERLAADAAEVLAARMHEAEYVHLAVSGGSLATRALPLLVQRGNEAGLDWFRLHLWFADERFVPRGTEERNATSVVAAMRVAQGFPSDHLHIPPAQDGSVSLNEAASAYERELVRSVNARAAGIPNLDLVLLGMGPDGHTASLFPNQLPTNTEALVVPVTDSPKPPPQRISLSFRLLDAARHCWIYATGAEKREALALARSGSASASESPVGRVRALDEVRIYADAAAS